MTDTTTLGTLAAEVMEALEDASRIQEEEGRALPELGEVIIVAEVRWPARDGAPLGSTQVIYKASDVRQWVQAGLLREALFEIDNSREQRSTE